MEREGIMSKAIETIVIHAQAHEMGNSPVSSLYLWFIDMESKIQELDSIYGLDLKLGEDASV